MAGVVHIPWYATFFRGDDLEAALADVAQAAMRYGAKSYAVYRYHDDRYKFLQTAEFDSHEDWEAYWNGHEMRDFRIICNGWYQVPVLYGWTDLVAGGSLQPPHVQRAVVGEHVEGDLAG